MQIRIDTLERLDTARFAEIADGYRSQHRYAVRKEETDARTAFTVELEELPQPFVKRWPHEAEELEQYQQAIRDHQLSLGAYAGDLLVGLVIAEPRPWNRSLWVYEFHVHADYRGQGLGRRLMEALIRRAEGAGIHLIVCETQNTNVPAVRFYRRMGFVLEGLDLALYPSEIEEVALFMKRRVR